jgi:hypothetical protein
MDFAMGLDGFGAGFLVPILPFGVDKKLVG